MTVDAGQAQWSHVLVVAQVQQGGGVADQLGRGLAVTSHAGVVQRAEAVLVSPVHISSLSHQQSYHWVNIIISTTTTIISLGYLEPGSEVEGGEAGRGGDVDLPAVAQQDLQDLQTVLAGSVVQGGDLARNSVNQNKLFKLITDH